MTTRPVTRVAQLPDPPRDPDSMEQLPHIAMVLFVLRVFFSHRSDVLVNGEGYLCIDTRIRPGQLKPDCVVAFGVDPKAIEERNGYVINEVGKPPDFVLEVGSPSTGVADYTTKRDGYARYGVTEYWRFDPSGGRNHDRPLGGDTLVDSGRYEPIPINVESGVHWGRSAVLGLDLYWQDGNLRFYDPAIGEFLPDYFEVVSELNAEKAMRLSAEAETRMLRERLRQYESDSQ